MSIDLDNKIVEKVKETLIEVCALEKSVDEIDDNASIINDLGADSLDFLDILFKLEEGFGVTIERGVIIKKAQGDLSDDQFIKDGYVTAEGMKRLKISMPEIDEESFPDKLKANEIMGIFSPRTFARIVTEQLEEKRQLEDKIDGTVIRK